MTASAMCCAVHGIAGVPVTVEADVSNGLPGFSVAQPLRQEELRPAGLEGGADLALEPLVADARRRSAPPVGGEPDLRSRLWWLQDRGHQRARGGCSADEPVAQLPVVGHLGDTERAAARAAQKADLNVGLHVRRLTLDPPQVAESRAVATA
jgi:hypothetical protein